MRTRRLALALTVSVAAVACSVEQVMPAPDCAEGGSALIVAQSVPSASLVPCLESLPEGWVVATVRIDQDGTRVALDSDRAGVGAAVLRLEAECDTAGAVSSPSELEGAERFDLIERVDPSFRASRFYRFPGGCVWWSFDFDRDASATESVAIGEVLGLVPRDALNENIRETFIDEEL